MEDTKEPEKTYTITAIKWISDTVLMCTLDSVTIFYLRTLYLEHLTENFFQIGTILSSEDFDDCVQAGLAYAVERKAMDYLNRNEHSRFLLKNKLIKKEYKSYSVEKALDYLEGKGYLDDKRYASAFLKNRAITHYEGSTRLYGELAKRGIDRKIAREAIDGFFEIYPEETICEKALKRFTRNGKTGEKLTIALQRAGFSLKMINQCQNGD